MELSNSENAARFHRNLGVLGLKGQKCLLSSHIVIVGLGGLGGHVLEQTVRAGVGCITGVDPDEFEPSNLNRQLLSDVSSLGTAKIVSAQERVRLIHPEAKFTGLKKRHDDVLEEVWMQADLVFDCLDSIEDRLSLAETCARADCTLIHGAIAGWFGQWAVVLPGSGLLGRLYPQTGPGLEKELGTPPFTAALCASLMVAEGVKILCGIALAGSHHVQYFNLEDQSFWSVEV